jgi:hypothetical protein
MELWNDFFIKLSMSTKSCFFFCIFDPSTLYFLSFVRPILALDNFNTCLTFFCSLEFSLTRKSLTCHSFICFKRSTKSVVFSCNCNTYLLVCTRYSYTCSIHDCTVADAHVRMPLAPIRSDLQLMRVPCPSGRASECNVFRSARCAVD